MSRVADSDLVHTDVALNDVDPGCFMLDLPAATNALKPATLGQAQTKGVLAWQEAVVPTTGLQVLLQQIDCKYVCMGVQIALQHYLHIVLEVLLESICDRMLIGAAQLVISLL